jgi:hypothetical protein
VLDAIPIDKNGTPETIGQEGIGGQATDFRAKGVGAEIFERIESLPNVRITIADVFGTDVFSDSEFRPQNRKRKPAIAGAPEMVSGLLDVLPVKPDVRFVLGPAAGLDQLERLMHAIMKGLKG